MSDDQPVVLEGIPVFTGDLALLDATVKELTKDGAKIATAAGDIHSSFGGLQAFYQAPEADQLFATTKPVADRGTALKSDLATITGALGTYSDEAYPLVEKLRQLKRDAGAFLVKVNADDTWREDGDLVEENNNRRNEIAETWAAFQAVERACYNKIIAMVPGGKPLTTNDGSGGKHMYGYDAEALKQAKGLPWGDPVKESTRWYQFYEHVWDFGKGFVVDGVWGTVKGLGTLFGTEGWDTAKQAWTGLGNLATGVILTVAAPHVLWLTPEKDLPGFARDARNAMKETGKALIAYDQWGENPARAGGAVTFNVLTTVFTGGAGGGASGAGKAAAAAKALSFANKASRVVDPTTYLFKGAGAGLTKISDVMAGLKGSGAVEIPPLPDNIYTLPEGGVRLEDGTVHLPAGTAIPDGAIRLPDGTVKLPEGSVALPEGTVRNPFDQGVPYVSREGHLYNEDGSVAQLADQAKNDRTPEGAPDSNTSRVDTPAKVELQPRELARVGSRGGEDTARLGSDVSDPVHSVDNSTQVSRPDTTPGSSVGNNSPRNDLDNAQRGGASHTGTTPPRTGGADDAGTVSSHADGTTIGRGHPDGPGANSHRPESQGTGGPGDVGNHADDASGEAGSSASGSDAPTHRADGDAAAGESGQTPERELTAAERKKLQDKHVWLANNDEAWRRKHYRDDAHRWDRTVKVDGVELPILKKLPDGTLIAKYDLPHGPSEIRHSRTPLKPESVDPQHLPKLDEAAKNSRVSVDLTNAKKAFDENPSALTRSDLDAAQRAYDGQLPGVPNNSKHSEKLGELASRYHAIPELFPTAKHIKLPKTPNGANMLDELYELGDDGNYLIVEQKGPKANLNPPRHGAGPAANMMVKQGTRPYLETIFHEMWKRGGKDRAIADKLFEALDTRKIQYVLVKGKERSGSYDGSVLEHLKIY
ncbi:hypothetical protein ABZ362_02365 [Streptomyces sp. NPDC005951]|uniref:hypothetical protein n=1 Tax=Streptomyces sp. NPDC005951 TaxID=3154573 RepID=UPI0033D45496